jgi:hypothetical protein
LTAQPKQALATHGNTLAHTHSINQTVQYAKTNETPGKYIHIKKKNRKNLFFLSATGSSWSFFMAPPNPCTYRTTKKIEREKRHSSW